MGFGSRDNPFKDKVDTVFLLSDGLPNCGQYEVPAEIRKGIRALNKDARIIIHTIFTGEGTGAADLRKLLGRGNGGRFVDRAKPGKK